MNDLMTFVNEITPQNLNEALNYLTKFGKPWLAYWDNQKNPHWYASIEMRISKKYATFEIKTIGEYQNPYEAIKELIKNVRETIQEITKTE